MERLRCRRRPCSIATSLRGGIVRATERTGGPRVLTLQHPRCMRVRARFPTIAEMCGRVGLDLATDCIPVGPAALLTMGGIDNDEWGRTLGPRVYAAGETACTGVQGANQFTATRCSASAFWVRVGDGDVAG